jgi:hypothetical protein
VHVGIKQNRHQAANTSGNLSFSRLVWHMDSFSSVIRHVVIFLWPIPFLLGFAVGQDPRWPEYLAYAVAGVLAAVAAGGAVAAMRRSR